MNAVKKAFLASIARNRRNVFVKSLARACNGVLYAYKNVGNFDFDSNGEKFVLQKYSDWNSGKECIIWDVGAHKGEWAQLAHDILGRSRIYSFEIMPSIFTAIPQKDWLVARNVGLSDRRGQVDVTFSIHDETSSSISPRFGSHLFAQTTVVNCLVETGDFLVSEGIPTPDLLKIDTEGHEIAVIKGCSQILSEQSRPKIIQFEYGQTYIPSKNTLQEAYEILKPNGYKIGRLFNDHVEFKDYSYFDENFDMGNMIAVCEESLKCILN